MKKTRGTGLVAFLKSAQSLENKNINLKRK